MREITVKLYQYDELSDEAKEKARDWYRSLNYDDFQEYVFEDAKAIAKLFGLEINEIFYSGFSSQGDGASFTGHYKYHKGALKAVREYAPKDEELHRIVKELQNIQSKNFYKISAYITRSGRYYHENTMHFDFMLDGEYTYSLQTFEDDLTEALRDYARWIYKQLEKAYEYQNSDEAVTETIIANEYEFTENGEPA